KGAYRFRIINEWNTVEMFLDNVKLDNINVYAAYTHDRNHLDFTQILFEHHPQQITVKDEYIQTEQYTIDSETAFQIGWDLG
ncbi:unnamed protein product, partial [Didymodactylos carnosus]